MADKLARLIELQLTNPGGPSFHQDYAHSCYVWVGGLDRRLTEGDVVTVFSQWGEVVDVNLIRDKETGESKGFAFLAYEDQRSTVLAVDNGHGMRLLGRTLRVDHVRNYSQALAEEEPQKQEVKQEQTRVSRSPPRLSEDANARLRHRRAAPYSEASRPHR